MTAQQIYPVRVEGELEQSLSRWLWLVKWLLLIPLWVPETRVAMPGS